MFYSTIDPRQSERFAMIECWKNNFPKRPAHQNDRFLLIAVTAGSLSFSIDGSCIRASAPTLLCFDEKHSPVFIKKEAFQYYTIYFHPTFLNINMTFDRIRCGNYSDIASNHNLFLLRPFLEAPCSVVPIPIEYQSRIETSCADLLYELREQRDAYWSCRSRSCFIELIIALERIYNALSLPGTALCTKNLLGVESKKLNDAVHYIESHYANDISLADIARACQMNRTTLAVLFKKGLGKTVFTYLMEYRIFIAKKILSFTSVPLKDISMRCGFKTVQHFTRVFKNQTGETPARYRARVLKKRIRDFAEMQERPFQ